MRLPRFTSVVARALRQDRGAAAVEFALIATPFVFVLFAIIESGLIFVAEMNLSNATMSLARQLRTGNVMASGTSSKTSGAVLSLSDFKAAICNKMSLVPLQTCTAQLQVDVHTQGSYGSAGSQPNPVSNGSFNTSSLCYNSGNSGSIVVFRAYYLWPVMTPVLLSPLVNASSYVVGNTTTSGDYHVIVSSEAFTIEQNASGSNGGSGC